MDKPHAENETHIAIAKSKKTIVVKAKHKDLTATLHLRNPWTQKDLEMALKIFGRDEEK